MNFATTENGGTQVDELIRRKEALDALLYAMCGTGHQTRAMNAIRCVPTIAPENLRVQGRWVWADDGYLRCSSCHQKAPQFEHQEALESYKTEHCPHCGTRMSNPGRAKKPALQAQSRRRRARNEP